MKETCSPGKFCYAAAFHLKYGPNLLDCTITSSYSSQTNQHDNESEQTSTNKHIAARQTNPENYTQPNAKKAAGKNLMPMGFRAIPKVETKKIEVPFFDVNIELF